MYSYFEEPLSAVQFLYNLESKTATNMEHVNMCVQPLSILKVHQQRCAVLIRLRGRQTNSKFRTGCQKS